MGMDKTETAAREQRMGKCLKAGRLDLSRRQRQHMDASRDFGERMIVFFDERLDAFLEGRDVRGEQAGLDTVKEMMEGEQSVDFRAVEPQPGQLVSWMLGI